MTQPIGHFFFVYKKKFLKMKFLLFLVISFALASKKSKTKTTSKETKIEATNSAALSESQAVVNSPLLLDEEKKKIKRYF